MSGETDNPEWTDEDLARAKPFREMFPKQHEAWQGRTRPSPPAEPSPVPEEEDGSARNR
jgi:uncharacterized protein (DUF4415 family)